MKLEFWVWKCRQIDQLYTPGNPRQHLCCIFLKSDRKILVFQGMPFQPKIFNLTFLPSTQSGLTKPEKFWKHEITMVLKTNDMWFGKNDFVPNFERKLRPSRASTRGAHGFGLLSTLPNLEIQACKGMHPRLDFLSPSPFFPYLLLKPTQKRDGKPTQNPSLLQAWFCIPKIFLPSDSQRVWGG